MHISSTLTLSCLESVEHNRAQLCFNASLLNSHCASVGTADNGLLPVCSDANVNFEPLCNVPFTSDNILKAIEKLKNNLPVSREPDDIHPLFSERRYMSSSVCLSSVCNL